MESRPLRREARLAALVKARLGPVSPPNQCWRPLDLWDADDPASAVPVPPRGRGADPGTRRPYWPIAMHPRHAHSGRLSALREHAVAALPRSAPARAGPRPEAWPAVPRRYPLAPGPTAPPVVRPGSLCAGYGAVGEQAGSLCMGFMAIAPGCPARPGARGRRGRSLVAYLELQPQFTRLDGVQT
jgi:hypothetical protein